MFVIVFVSIVLGALLVWALYAEVVPPRARFRPARLDPAMTGADLRRHDFPLVVAGYDPRWVDTHLKQIAVIHDQLRQAAGTAGLTPSAVQRSPNASSVRDVAALHALHVDRTPSVLDE